MNGGSIWHFYSSRNVFTVRWGRSSANPPHPPGVGRVKNQKRETREESQLQHGCCCQMGLVFIEQEYSALVPLFFEGKISRMSSTTSWVRATYTCHHFRSPFRTATTLHSTYFFTHLSSYMYSQAISTCSHSPTCGTQSIWVVVHARLGAYAGVLYISDLTNYMQTPRRRINK